MLGNSSGAFRGAFQPLPAVVGSVSLGQTHPAHLPGRTVADGAQRVVILHALADDPPLGEEGVGAQGVHVKAAPGAHEVVGADVTRAAADGKVPVGQSEGGILQHVLPCG